MVDVSVIVPAYNEARHISRCLDSLLRQDFDSFEVVVVDDGSVDGTSEVVKQYVLRYPGKVRLLRLRKNVGAGNARNIGALYARGKVIAFLDADMEFTADFISKLVKPIFDGIASSSCYGTEVVANSDNPWVMVQTPKVKNVALAEKTGFVRAVDRELFLRYGGFDARFGYFDDHTFYRKTGIESVVIKDAIAYHYHPDSIREVFWKNFWTGRSVLSVHKTSEVLVMLIKRLLDLSIFLSLTFILANSLLLKIIGVFLILGFILTVLRHRILKPSSFVNEIVLKLFYVPIYRWVRAIGFISGLLYRLVGGYWRNIESITENDIVVLVTGEYH
jgi:glycosyltransferase involved in cell wall biosynthesis